jgi:hypothetical protein
VAAEDALRLQPSRSPPHARHKTKISFVAVNGFTGWLRPEDVDGSDWIIALEVDGTPLGIGQQGPLWLINTRTAGQKPDLDGRRRCVWGLFYMRVGE